jgi:hypothetical protein
MYGKKRVVINKRNQIVIAGAKFLKEENRMDNKLTDENSITLTLPTIKAIREEIKKIYNII